MRSLLLACLVVALVPLASGVANAADQGQVPSAVLADLGMGGMQVVSDVQGEQIRGKWIVPCGSCGTFSAFQCMTVSTCFGKVQMNQGVTGPCPCALPECMTQSLLFAGAFQSIKF
jgi:hypothetical protein